MSGPALIESGDFPRRYNQKEEGHRLNLWNVIMKVLVFDIGGTNVKFLASGHKTARQFPEGHMTDRDIDQLAS